MNMKCLKINYPKDKTYLVAVSGGPDSMALLHMLKKIKDRLDIQIVCAHVNHNVRKESEEEYNKINSKIQIANEYITRKKQTEFELRAKIEEMAGITTPVITLATLLKPDIIVPPKEITFPATDITEVTAPTIVPIAETTLPMIIKSGPTAATTAPIVTIICICSSLKEFNFSTKEVTNSVTCLITGIIAVPIRIARDSKAPRNCSIDPARLSIMISAISSAAPAEL